MMTETSMQLCSLGGRPRPAAPYPRPQRLGLLAALREVRYNPITIFSEEAYTAPFVEYREYGGIVLINDPETIMEVFLGESTKFAKSNQYQRLLAPALGKGLATAEGRTWETSRRIIAPFFSPRAIAKFVKVTRDCSEAMIRRWQSREAPDVPLDISSEMLRLTYEIISKALTSGDLDGDRERVHDGIERYLDTVGRFDLPTALDLPVWVPGLNTLRALPAIAAVRRIVARLVDHRMKDIEREASDLLDELVRTQDPKTGETLTRGLICDNVRTFLAAGHDSTGLALTWIIYLLALHPDAESRVVGELGADNGDAPHSVKASNRLAYLRAVVNESLRLYPPFPFVSVRPLTTVELSGRRLKPSTPVSISAWVVHRHRALWDEPDFFKPERFLPQAAKSIPRGAFIPFGLGPRGCVGANFAMQTILIVLATVLPRFKFRLANAESVFPEARVTLRPAGGLPAFVTPRQ